MLYMVTTKRNIEEVSAYINISWGQYMQAPAEVIFRYTTLKEEGIINCCRK